MDLLTTWREADPWHGDLMSAQDSVPMDIHTVASIFALLDARSVQRHSYAGMCAW